MLSNMEMALLAKLGPDEALRIAEYLEAAATRLRFHAESEQAATAAAESHRQMLLKARQDARALLRLGQSERLTAAQIGRKYRIPPDWAVAQVKVAAGAEAKAAQDELVRKVLKLKRQGKSIRAIAEMLEKSKSSVHRMIRDGLTASTKTN